MKSGTSFFTSLLLELLMPLEFLEDDLKSLPEDMDTGEAIRKLAKKYQVSTLAMTIRLRALGALSLQPAVLGTAIEIVN